MKKNIITLIFALGFGMSLNAQSDGFFTYNESSETNRSTSWSVEAALPTAHGLTDHQSAEAPLGSGILLLAGLAFAYGRKRRNEN
ncbi:MAG: hypothetical protein IJZ06_08935 [Bacteroidales bacterium]|nr:hypothetical protein [Bacteroidales bacterium]